LSTAEVTPGIDLQAERAEVEWLLESGLLGRSTNVARLLRIICEKFFAGEIDQIKEYTIAVEGMGRSQGFDPQTDPIVRVTAHSLRKRLADYYRGEGADRLVHVSLPLGHYIPHFTHHVPAAETSIAVVPPNMAVAAPMQETGGAGRASRRLQLWVTGLSVLLLIAGGDIAMLRYRRHVQANVPRAADARMAPIIAEPLRMLVGADRAPYTDHSGTQWVADQYCTGGDSFAVPPTRIAATEDQEMFLGGRRGIFHCTFPVAPGMYEARLYFAETTDVPDATRTVIFTFNGKQVMTVDVVDVAPGNYTATERVIPGVSPGVDGKIHLDFINTDSFVNAVELLPSTMAKIAPIRIAARESAYTDSKGQVWSSDRYFVGGRRNRYTGITVNGSAETQYSWARIGHFTYSIPVDPDEKYTVRLHFIEPWFGNQNSGLGGKGNRIFDVSANGTNLLKNFDIFSEGGTEPVVKTFSHITPNGLGKIELSFTPVNNYALVSGIEIIPE
jgi:Malectin domain